MVSVNVKHRVYLPLAYNSPLNTFNQQPTSYSDPKQHKWWNDRSQYTSHSMSSSLPPTSADFRRLSCTGWRCRTSDRWHWGQQRDRKQTFKRLKNRQEKLRTRRQVSRAVRIKATGREMPPNSLTEDRHYSTAKLFFFFLFFFFLFNHYSDVPVCSHTFSLG